ncbi:PAS domain-containing protein, partial [Actinosynnema sp. NPDC023658]|uniref:PAS domain-containing protein n=1 Tax=Actinosynnema sp. NPDC023658 TaxID=3155465 RepID=UPI0033C64E60
MTQPVGVTPAGGSTPTAVEAWALPELFRQVFVGSPAGIALFDARGALVAANPALEALLP